MRKHLSNSAWFMGQSVLTQALLFSVIAVVARYLGAEAYGNLSYVLSVCAILTVFAQFGLDNVVIRGLVTAKGDEGAILGTAFCLSVVSCLAATAAFVSYGHLMHAGTDEERLFLLAAGYFVILPFLTPNLWLLAYELARYSSISQMFGQITSASARGILVISSGSLFLFASANTVQLLFTGAMTIIFYIYSGGPSLNSWTFSWPEAKKIVSESAQVLIGNILGIIYLKVDVTMLRWMAGPTEAGLYSIAAQISEASYFIPGAVLAAVFPDLIRAKKKSEELYTLRFRQIVDLMLLTSIAVIAFVTVVGYYAIPFVFGSDFAASSQILVIHALAMPFVFMGTAYIRWLLVEKFMSVFLVTQGAGAAANILLNLVFIPMWGGQGAALATVLSYMIGLYLSLYIVPKTRPIFRMMSSALFIPWRSAQRVYALRLELR